MANEFAVSIKIGLKDFASAGLRNLKRDFSRSMTSIQRDVAGAGRSILRHIGGAIDNTIRKLVGFARIAALATAGIALGFGFTAVRAFADYEQSVANALSVTSLMGDELERANRLLFDFGLDLSTRSNKLPTEIISSAYELYSAGLDTRGVMGAMPGILQFAEGTQVDTGYAGQLGVSASKAWGIDPADMDRIMNAMAAITQVTMLKPGELLTVIGTVGSDAARTNVSLEQLLGTIGVLRNRGIDASRAATGLRTTLNQLAAPSAEAQAQLAKFGLSAADVRVQTRGLIPVLTTLQRLGGGPGVDQLLKSMVGVEYAGMLDVLRQNTAELSKWQRAVTGTDAALRMQRRQLNTVGGQWKAFLGDIQKLQIIFVRAFSPSIRGIIADLRGMAARLGELKVAERAGAWLGNMARQATAWIGKMLDPARLAAMKQWIVDTFNTAKQIGANVVQALSGNFARLRQLIPQGLSGLWDFVQGKGPAPTAAFAGIWREFDNIARRGVTAVVGHVDRMLAQAFGPGQWAAIKAQIVTTAGGFLELAEAAGPAIKELLPLVVDLVREIAKFAAAHPYLALIAIGIVKLIGPISAVGGALKWVWGVGAKLAAWFSGSEGLAAVMATGLGEVVIAAGLVVSSIALIYYGWKDLITAVDTWLIGRKTRGKDIAGMQQLGIDPTGVSHEEYMGMSTSPETARRMLRDWGSQRPRDFVGPQTVMPTARQTVRQVAPSAATGHPGGWDYDLEHGGRNQRWIPFPPLDLGAARRRREAESGATYLGGSAAGPGRQAAITVNINGDVYGVDDLDSRIHQGVRAAMA